MTEEEKAAMKQRPVELEKLGRGKRMNKKNIESHQGGLAPSQEIDNIIRSTPDWKGRTLSALRSVILKADSSIVEEVKWKKPSKPSGVPVWSCEGIICVADTLKNSIRLTFHKGAKIQEQKNLFNTRLDSKTVRAIDFGKEDTINQEGLEQIILEAIELNRAASKSRKSK